MNTTVLRPLRIYYIVTITALFIIHSVQFISYNVNDFCQNYIAAQKFVAQTPIYTPIKCWTIPFPTDTQYSAHPPSSLFLYVPLTIFSEQTANYIFDIVSVCCYVLAGMLLLRVVQAPFIIGYTFFLLFSYYWYPFHIANSIHNVSSILFLLLSLSAFAYTRGKKNIAASALGIAGLIKLWPLIILSGFFLTGNASAGKKGLLIFVIGWIMTIILLGIPNIQTYITNVIPNEKYFLADPNNWTISAMIIRPVSGYPFMGMKPFFKTISLEQISVLASILSALYLTLFLLLLKRMAVDYPYHKFILIYGYTTLVAFITFPLMWNWNVPVLLVVVALAAQSLTRTHGLGPLPTILFVGGILPLLFGQWQTPLTLLGIVDSLSPWKTILAGWPLGCLLVLLWYFLFITKSTKPDQFETL